MVDGHTGGDGGLHLILGVGQLLDVVVGGHGSQGDHRVQHIVHTADNKGDVLGEQMMGEAVEEADYHQNQGVGYHDGFVTDLVDDPAHQRSGKEAGHRGDSEKQTDGGGAGTVKQNQHIGAEGEEDLLSCAVEHLQHIVLGILLVEIEPALVFVGLAFAGDLHGAQGADTGKNRRQGEEQFIGRVLCNEGEGQYDHQVAGQCAHLVDGALDTLGSAALAGFGIFQREGALHTQLDVLAQRVNADGQGGEDFGGGQHRMHAHTGQHDHRAHLEEGLCREHIEHRQDEHQRNAGQFPEKLGDAPIHFAHGNHFRQVIIQHALVKTIGQAGDQHR